MRIFFLNLLKNIAFLVLSLIKPFLGGRNAIIFESSSHYRYGGNPKYIFEYLSLNTQHNVYWITESEEVKKYLDSRQFKYISNAKFIHKLIIILKTKIIIGSGTSFYNPFFLFSRNKDVIKICTMHGSGPKLTIPRLSDIDKTIKAIKIINSFN